MFKKHIVCLILSILFNSAAGILTAAVGYQAPVKPARIASAILFCVKT